MSIPIYIRTETPLHIGSGRDISPFEYFVDKGMYYRWNEEKIFEKLYQINPDFSDLLNQWIEANQTKLDDTFDNKRQSKIRNSFTLSEFIKSELKKPELDQEIRKNPDLYTLYGMPSTGLGGKKTFREQYKTASNEVLILGSSIKGSIRTALLYDALIRLPESRKARVKAIIERSIAIGKANGKDVSLQLENEFFGCGYEKGNVMQPHTDYSDAKFSLLKLISFTDSDTKLCKDASKTAIVDLYLVNQEKIQPQTPIIEAIKSGQVFESRFSFDLSFVLMAKKLLNDPQKTKFGKTEWLGFKEKFEYLYNIDISTLNECSANQFEKKIWDHIQSACNKFGKAIAKKERRYADKHSRLELKQMYDEIENSTIPTSKLGWASGFPATTVFLALENDPFYAESVIKLFEKYMLGVNPQAKNAHKAFVVNPSEHSDEITIYTSNFPASRRYETDVEDINALGWISWHEERPPQLDVIDKFELEAQKQKETRQQKIEESKSYEPTPMEKVGNNTTGIYARVVDNTKRPLKVKLYVIGYENDIIECTGCTPSSYEIGQLLIVSVNIYSPKKKRVINVHNPSLPK
jgi:CRISPR-associated protein Csm5